MGTAFTILAEGLFPCYGQFGSDFQNKIEPLLPACRPPGNDRFGQRCGVVGR